jgi:hypothetical protein
VAKVTDLRSPHQRLDLECAGQQEVLTNPVVLEVRLGQGVDFAPQGGRLGWVAGVEVFEEFLPLLAR